MCNAVERVRAANLGVTQAAVARSLQSARRRAHMVQMLHAAICSLAAVPATLSRHQDGFCLITPRLHAIKRAARQRRKVPQGSSCVANRPYRPPRTMLEQADIPYGPQLHPLHHALYHALVQCVYTMHSMVTTHMQSVLRLHSSV